MTDLFNSGLRALRTPLPLLRGRRRTMHWAWLALPLGLLVACGGGESEESPPAPTMVRVDTPPRAAAATTAPLSTGIESSGALNYQVWGGSDVATGTGTTASAHIVAEPEYSTPEGQPPGSGNLIQWNTDITFAAVIPFANGLKIGAAHHGVNWPTDATVDMVVIKGGGVSTTTWPASYATWSGSLLSLGNYFVFCSAGAATASVTAQTARTGAQVAISSRFVPMDNLAPLYGKRFYRFDCAGTTDRTTFGDGQGHLTMAFDGITLSEAQTVQAFSDAGYAPAAGQIIKRRAYSIVINGATRYAIVALDNRGSPYASVLFQPEE